MEIYNHPQSVSSPADVKSARIIEQKRVFYISRNKDEVFKLH